MTTAENIQAMLQSVRDERATLKARDEMLKQREGTLLAWLKEEAIPAQGDLPINGNLSSLGTFLISTLAPGKKLTTPALGDLASERGLIERDVSPGRAVHGALLGLQNQGYVRKNDDGTWSRQ